MKKRFFHLKSLYLELGLSLLLCIGLAILVFYILDTLFINFAYSNWINKEYNSKHLAKAAEEFQIFIDDNSLASTDYDSIFQWSSKQTAIYFYLSKDGVIIFDPNYEPDEITDGDYYSTTLSFLENAGYSYERYTINFSDGSCTMYLNGDFQYLLYQRLTLLNVFVSISLTLLLFSLLIRKKILYIHSINDGIKILEAGNLDYPISVKGEDELAQLATSLNSMRIALSQQMENEKKALRANSSLVTALSHDLRTPLTTQMGYLEILKEHHYNTPEEMDKYIATALDTCNRIKEMSDRLFEYFLAFDPHPERPANALEEYDALELFMQLFAEHSIPLENQGFIFDFDLPDSSFSIHINMDDMLRIFNNIFSNIDKYADETAPVKICIKKEPDSCLVSISNKIRLKPRKNESAKIGLISVNSLMKRQGGSSITRTSEKDFTIELTFPTLMEY